MNAAALRLLGAASADQIVGKTIAELFDEPGQARVRMLLERPHFEAAHRFEDGLVRVDGAVVDVEAVIAPLAEGAIQLVLRDITNRKRAEHALRDSEERLTLAFAGAQEGVWYWNLETGAVVYSSRWKEMLGYGDEDVEPHVRAWERLLHPDDRPRADELHDELSRGRRTYEGE